MALSALTRRVMLTTVIASAGLYAWFRRAERALPDARESGAGAPVDLILFSDNGTSEGVAHLHKIAKTDAEWRRELSANEYAVTRAKATEFAFTNRYWNNHETGIYRCICCGSAVFRSQEKFDSDTGWPSFVAPIAAQNIETAADTMLAETRTEVLCRKCDAHLGHVFPDGPPPTGLRYCLNSAALRFVRSQAQT